MEMRSKLDIDPERGLFYWKKGIPGRRAGQVAGCTDSAGYVRIRLANKLHHAHRLMWLYVHGYLPDNHIDHINCDKHDNKISNLRLATRSQNLMNRGKTSRNTSGLKGIYFNKQSSKWRFDLRVDRKLVATYQSKCKADVYLRYIVEVDKHVGSFGRLA